MTDNILNPVMKDVLTPVILPIAGSLQPDIVFKKNLSTNLTDGIGPPVLFTGTENYNANGILIDGSTYLRVPSAGLINDSKGFMFLQWTPNYNGVDMTADIGILRSGNNARFFYGYLSTRTVVSLDSTFLLDSLVTPVTGQTHKMAVRWKGIVNTIFVDGAIAAQGPYVGGWGLITNIGIGNDGTSAFPDNARYKNVTIGVEAPTDQYLINLTKL